MDLRAAMEEVCRQPNRAQESPSMANGLMAVSAPSHERRETKGKCRRTGVCTVQSHVRSTWGSVHSTHTVHRAEGLWRCTRSAAVVLMNCTNHIAEALACCESRLCWLEPPDGRRVL